LINFLKKENIPATLFVSGLWIDYNLETFMQLSGDPLFELENHGLNHRLCSVNGAEKFGITGTGNVGEVIDEMELNSRKMQQLTGKKPVFFRSSTVYTDEASAKIANRLGLKIISYSVLSGDVNPDASAKSICNNIIRQIKPGSIVIMHFNHPNWKERQALVLAVPILRERGYHFVQLKNYSLISKN
jgi:peptidoglycan/xylan/chitin deacetylase (PgdA/CDA1 family)